MDDSMTVPHPDEVVAMPRGGAVSKMAKFGWLHVSDKMPEMAYVNKRQLRIDPTYQRAGSLKESTIVRVASAFRWKDFGCLLVARRNDGSLWVFDGMHRLLGVNKRSDITTVPCLIYDVEAVGDEASAFVGVNSNRGSVRSVDKWRAMIVHGDPETLRLKALLDSNGIAVSDTRTAKTLDCVKTLIRLDRSDSAALAAILPIAIELSEGEPVHHQILEALHYIYRQIGARLLQRQHLTRLRSLGRNGVMQAIGAARAYYNKGGDKVLAEGVVNALNKGLSVNRIDLSAERAA